MRLAIIADWLPTFGGAEHVIAELHALWPEAPIFTTVARHGHLGPLDHADIRTSTLQKWYRLLGRHEVLLPWMPRAIEAVDLRAFDTVMSSSHAVAKGIIPSSSAVHVCYCHTPMRYAWEMEEEYLRDFRVPKMLRRTVRRTLKHLRRWDMTTARRVDRFLANSRTTQERISRVYGRESTVIPPPVQEKFLKAPLSAATDRKGFLAIGRLVPYKRFDLLIAAANQLHIPLTIAGNGSDFARLKALAGPTVHMLGFVPDADLPDLYGHARALLLPQVEDAGVVPLEAQACGTPVIALRRGGVLDTVQDGVTGMFFGEQTVDALQGALERFGHTPFDHAAIREHARQFSSDRFRERIEQMVMRVIEMKK
ncbi:MAG: glycosyltransferase [Candidatus Peribacteraceae bacterium]|nr:glycosyltransferase [Candidatus Peribacteraceae bacterium]MDD5742548.1 glycosyltransferase [Candidatus Peribacteraceae bacterium]